MEKASVDDVEPVAIEDDSDQRGLSDSLGTTTAAVNRYRIAPGEGLPSGLHAHADQEEIFVVLEGEATFETFAPSASPEGDADGAGSAERASAAESGAVVVGGGEAIRFAPGEFQSGKNESDDDLVMLAIGAPRDSEDVRIPQACPDCGHGDLRLDAGEGGVRLVCPACGGEYVPQPCPDCGHDDLRVALDDGNGTVVVCRGCSAEFEDAPLRG